MWSGRRETQENQWYLKAIFWRFFPYSGENQSFSFHAVLQLIGWGPPTPWRAICSTLPIKMFISSQNPHANTQNDVLANTGTTSYLSRWHMKWTITQENFWGCSRNSLPRCRAQAGPQGTGMESTGPVNWTWECLVHDYYRVVTYCSAKTITDYVFIFKFCWLAPSWLTSVISTGCALRIFLPCLIEENG